MSLQQKRVGSTSAGRVISYTGASMGQNAQQLAFEEGLQRSALAATQAQFDMVSLCSLWAWGAAVRVCVF